MKKKYILAEPVVNAKEVIKLANKVLSSNFFNEGKYTKLVEKKISNLLKVKYAVATTSGTVSLFLALKSIGIKKNDEIIIPNITFPATANAVELAGGKPVLVDINKEDLLINTKSLLKNINKKTRAIIPVHISGRGSNIETILKIARNKKLFVIEDAAEAFMSKKNKKYLGTFGHLGCFSFAPNKIFTTGQGGVIVTNNKSIYKKLYRLKDQGRTRLIKGGDDKYSTIGYNFKFTELQAVLGLTQLNEIKKRKRILINHYAIYKKNLIQNKNFKLIGFDIKNGEVPLWIDVYCSKRNKLYNFLSRKKINCRYFWQPLNMLEAYKKSFYNLENSKKINKKLMWLPSSLNLKKNDLLKICNQINKFYSNK